MATAYAALVSLYHNMYLIKHHPRHSFHFEQEQVDYLWEIAAFLMDFMKGYDNSHGARAEALERRIARAAQAVEDVIVSHVVDQIRGGKTKGSKTTSLSTRYLLDLQKVIEDMDYVGRKAIKIYLRVAQSGVEADKQQQQPAYSSTPLTSNKTTAKMVDLMMSLFNYWIGSPEFPRVVKSSPSSAWGNR